LLSACVAGAFCSEGAAAVFWAAAALAKAAAHAPLSNAAIWRFVISLALPSVVVATSPSVSTIATGF
jgi:hypothetical protein